ncbi:hypothetical protein ABZ725_04460 [Streptomyces sp. NPDC006872]|uniref:hypothetical protein n=1 Tax=Streptomyces sp. NPDC006872 TaxID=3155720 RepID=UPI0033F97F33
MTHRLRLIRQRALRRIDQARTAGEGPAAQTGRSDAVPPAWEEPFAPVISAWTPSVDDYRISTR